VTHHRIALATIAAALVLDFALGLAYSAATPHLPWWHGLYCALANAVTDGGDVQPQNGAGYAIQAAEYVTVVPLVAATFSLFTSALSSVHVHASERRLKAHIELHGRGEAP
jgi:hypothetical protein